MTSSTDLPPDGGLLLVDKPSGCTSHDVVGRVRWLLGTRRVGHAGTLDPMATGLLVIAVERSTKLLGHLALTAKSYQATIRLGQATSTDDAEGEPIGVLDPAATAALTDAAIAGAVENLTGRFEQVPSAVSAIKVDGRRSYARVRAGEAVALAARPVTVSRFDIVGSMRRVGGFADADVEVDCSTGTYVRALARDLGGALGVGGHLTRLRRTSVGPFGVAAAVDVFGAQGVPRPGEDQPARDGAGSRQVRDGAGSRPVRDGGRQRQERPDELVQLLRAALIPAAAAVRKTFPVREVDAQVAADLRHGRPIEVAGIVGTYAVFLGGRLLALVRESQGLARPELVWAPAG